jgi:hypothetical protein
VSAAKLLKTAKFSSLVRYCSGKREEGRGKREEGRGKREEGRGKREDER